MRKGIHMLRNHGAPGGSAACKKPALPYKAGGWARTSLHQAHEQVRLPCRSRARHASGTGEIEGEINCIGLANEMDPWILCVSTCIPAIYPIPVVGPGAPPTAVPHPRALNPLLPHSPSPT